jgi:hypothetical protein
MKKALTDDLRQKGNPLEKVASPAPFLLQSNQLDFFSTRVRAKQIQRPHDTHTDERNTPRDTEVVL